MQVTVSRVSPVLVEVKVSVPKERVNSALAQAYTTLGRQAQVRGFRKGKVPLPILKQFYGSRVTAEVWGRLVDETLPRALEDQKLEPVVPPGSDDIVPSEMPVEGTDWTYTAKLEVRPDLETIHTDGIDVKRKIYSVTDADVEHQIDHMREEHAIIRTPEPPRAALPKDAVTIDYDVIIDGKATEALAVRNRTILLGDDRLLKELEEGIPGMNAGESREIKVTFGLSHPREAMRGKDAVIRVTVTEVRERILPTVDDEFAKDTGADSLATLRANVRGRLEREAKQATDMQFREDAVAALAEKNPVEVPPSLVNNAVAVIARELAQQLRLYGGAMDPEKVIADAKAHAELRVRAGLLLSELAKKFGVTVTEDDINARIEEMAKETGKAAAKVRAENREPRKRQALASAALEDKVFALFVSKIKVTDVPADKPLHDHDH